MSEVAATLAVQNQDDITSIVSNTQKITTQFVGISENLSTSSRDLSEITHTVSSGQGTLGRLVKDDALYNSLVNFASQASEFMETINGDSSWASS